jgi:hypothetical protein
MHGASVPSSLFSLSHRLHPTPISSPLTFMLGTSKKKQLDPTEYVHDIDPCISLTDVPPASQA